MTEHICKATGKVAHVRHQDADKVVGSTFASKKDPRACQRPQSIYKCEHCGRWHVTSYSPELTRAIQDHRRSRRKGK